MFIADVAMGNMFRPNGPRSDLPLKGYDSTFAEAGKSGVQNNEMVIYKLEQCNLKYLCEFE
jgi:poly [ADP-ribose] polymerase